MGEYTTPEGSRTWEFLATFFCVVFVLCVGAVIGWTSPSIVKLMEPNSTIPITTSDASSMAALVAIGHMTAPVMNSLMIDRIGRKNTLMISGIPLVFGWALIAVAESVTILLVARFILGLAFGFCLCVVPLYLAEIATTKSRGATGMTTTVMMNTGILFAFLVGPHMSISTMASLFLGISVVFLIGFWFMPETPYFLAMVGRKDEAEEVLERLRGKTDVSDELEEIASSLHDKSDPGDAGSVMEIFKGKANRRALLIVISLIATHHFGGYVTILSFGQLIFKDIGTAMNHETAIVIVGAVQVASCIAITFVVDRWGRKPLLFASGFLVGLCDFVVGGYFYATEYSKLDMSKYETVPFVAIFLLILGYGIGLMPLQLVIMSEVFSTKMKAVGSSLIGVIGGVLATISVKVYFVIAVTWGYGHSLPFLAYFVTVWTCTGTLMFICPETKGKSFAEIQKELGG